MNKIETELLIDKNGNQYYVLKDSKLENSNSKVIHLTVIDLTSINNISIKKINNEHYYENKLLHREDGPAIVEVSGHKQWYKNGKLHREDGPAIEYVDGHKEYAINGNKVSEEMFFLEKELKEKSKNNFIDKKNKI